jgi:opacity protein-like surface antigen
MKICFGLIGVFLCLLTEFLTLPLLGQYSLESDSLYLDEYEVAGSAIPPFYQSLEEKKYYHSRQIHGMKKDLNAHSRNLQDLRARFNHVFYGRAGLDANGAPFRIGDEPKMPSSTELKPEIVYIPPATYAPTLLLEGSGSAERNTFLEPPTQSLPAEDMLAFSVEAPGDYLGHDGNPLSPPNDSGITSGAVRTRRVFSYYIMPRAGIAVTSKVVKYPDLYKRYRPGFSAGLSGGIRSDRWRMGLSVLHQRNLLHSSSWSGARTNRLSGDVTTNALLAEFSYGIPVFASFSVNVNGGLGYRKTTTSLEFLGTPFSQVDNGFVWSAGTGLEWSFTEQASLLLAYRYFAEETVPTHNADLGLEFDF